MRRRLIAVALTTVALSGVGAAAAIADSSENSWGMISGFVDPLTANYTGWNKDKASTGGCTTVQGKINGSYTGSGISGGGKTVCNPGNQDIWNSTAAFRNTATAIRLLETGTGNTLYLCTNLTACQAME